MKIFKMTVYELLQMNLNDIYYQLCKSVFNPFSVSKFRILTPDDGLPKSCVLTRKRVMDMKVQARKNDRQRGYKKVWDTILSDYEGVEFKGNF